MGRSGCFNQTREDCAFHHCLARFRDANGNPSTIKTAYAIPYITTDSPFGPTSRSSTILINDTNTIVGIMVSVIVIIIPVLVILVFIYRSLRNTKKEPKACDQTHVISVVNQSNTSYHDESIEASNEMYANTCTVTLENKHLDSNEIDEGTRSDDPLHTTHAVDTDKTNYKSRPNISTEGYSNDEQTKETLAIDK
ncbi:Hypothetical predicted protein [Mytilus galloprovincialis]|uniref:Uncharacterized protein n=1 Tax=Mytilus galloprovincialis TaxID=29158 RepID=A0A8B6DIF9_MYTGA|nr:Hypothetical predicted protein [Mytilus galloprovincialis]